MGSNNFYGGSAYGQPDQGDETFLKGFGEDYSSRVSAGSIGVATDGRTLNQIKATSAKINTGTKVIEVSGLSGANLEGIPKQHFGEINRLRKLTGVDLTFHGPLVDSTGLSQQGWDAGARKEAEKTMVHAVERAHDLNPDGNVVVTFHSSNVQLPDYEKRVKDAKTGKISVEELWVFDKNENQVRSIKPKFNPLLNKTPDAYEELKYANKELWDRQVSHAAFQASQGKSHIEDPLARIGIKEKDIPDKLKDVNLIETYYLLRTKEGKNFMKEISSDPNPNVHNILKKAMDEISFGEAYAKDSYNELNKLFMKAWDSYDNDKETMDKLKEFRKDMTKTMAEFEKDPSTLPKFSDSILQGVNLMNTLQVQSLKPMKEFAIEQASETFSNTALEGFAKFGKTSPIVSIENGPAGGPLTRAEDMRTLIKDARNKFVNKAMISKKDGGFGMGKEDAKKQAEKLIGATWDVGHINMIKKFGYNDKDLLAETKDIAPFVKHVHLSDNFGLEHTELPMGMGNVPTEGHMKLIEGYNKQVKKIIETGGWYGPQAFGDNTPFAESLKAFGSPIYSAKAGPFWNQTSGGTSGGYFTGYGQMLTDNNFNTYGAGFSNLPLELGGQSGGRSRASGAPFE